MTIKGKLRLEDITSNVDISVNNATSLFAILTSADRYAIGKTAVASGIGAISYGENAKADSYSISIGSGAGNTSGIQNLLAISIGQNANSGVSNIGAGSIAIGQLSNSISAGDIAIGIGAKTTGAGQGVAVGNGSRAGTHSVSIGLSAGTATVDGALSVSVGRGANSAGAYIGYASVAVGYLSSSSNDNAVAIGLSAVSGGFNSTAVGASSNAPAHSSTAFGAGTSASGIYSTSIGVNSQATTTSSFALGINAGRSTGGTVGDTYISIGADSNFSALGIGAFSVALGSLCHTPGGGSIGIGTGVTVSGLNAGAINLRGTSTFENSVASTFIFNFKAGDGALDDHTFGIRKDCPEFPVLTVATVPTALNSRVGLAGVIIVTDEAGGRTLATSDGTNWRRVNDGAIIS
jgi:hypothetical protein